ncbi:MAG: S8 family serine peptidase [Alphaproteobacteria bacterium]|nr:S8 family serine peptidase [Alphaproteobacteria bacterium]
MVNQTNNLKKNLNLLTLTLLSTLSIVSNVHAAGVSPMGALGDLTASMMEDRGPAVIKRKVAVVDNGFDVNHPELKKNLSKGYNGRDNTNDVNASIIMDKNHHDVGKIANHGTHVAGIVAGITPNVELVPYKTGARGHRTTAGIVADLKEILNKDDETIVNLSFGFNWNDMIDPIVALAQKGKTVVLAAGNEGEFVYDQYISSHGKMLSQILKGLSGRVVFVAATETKEGVQKLTSFSNKASPTMSEFFIAAHGKNVNSTVPFDTDVTGKKEFSGTSMAAPVYAAAIRKLADRFGVTEDRAREALFTTAKKLDPKMGQGVMDFPAAWNLLKGEATLPVTY